MILAPHTFGFISWTGRDIWFTEWLLVTIAILAAMARKPSRSRDFRWVTALAFAALLTIAMRQNALLTMPPLAFAWLEIRSRLTLNGWLIVIRRGLIACGISLVLTAVLIAFTSTVVRPIDTYPEATIFIHDLAGMSKHSGRDVIPKRFLSTGGTEQQVRERFSFMAYETVRTPNRPFEMPFEADGVAALRSAWLKAIRKHPRAYLATRWESWAAQATITMPASWVTFRYQ